MIRPVLFSFFVRFMAALLNFTVIIMLSNELGTIGKGICSRYITIIANALIFCDFVGGPPLVYMTARYSVSSILTPSYLWSLITSAITISVFFLFGQIAKEELLLMILLSFLNSCIAIHQNILSGKMKFTQLNTVILIQALLVFICLKYFFSLSGGSMELTPSPMHYLISLGISYGVGTMLGFLLIMNLEKIGKQIGLFSFLREAFKYGFINISGHALQFINQRLSYFLLLPSPLGIFSNASSVGESLWLIPNSMATVQYGKISNVQIKRDAERITLNFFKANLYLSLFASTVLLLIPDKFFVWLFGVDFTGMNQVLFYLVPGLFLFSGYLILGHHFSGTGNFILNLQSIGIGLIITATGVGIILVSKITFNLQSAAILTTLSYTGNFVYSCRVFFKNSGLSYKELLLKKEDIHLFRKEIFNRAKRD